MCPHGYHHSGSMATPALGTRDLYIQRITMCPHGYHHSGSMATPALGTRDVRLHIVWIALWSHQSAQTASSERCIVQKVNVPQGGSPPNPRECSNCTGSERNIQRITMCPIYIYIGLQRALTAITIVALFWIRNSNLGLSKWISYNL